MRVLFATSEIAGIYKRGGLGDVLYSLPVALSRLGVECALIMPFYASIKSDTVHCVGQMAVDFDGKRELVFVFEMFLADKSVPVYLIRHPILNEYNGKEMAATFAFFSACVVRLYLYAPQVIGGTFDIIHCHDWHTALIPLLLGENDKSEAKKTSGRLKRFGSRGKETMEARATKTILTIHNLMYVGETGTSIIHKTGIPKELFHMFKTPLGNAIKLLREGLDYVDIITTVSPSYAKEISSHARGHIGSVLAARRDKVIGILNGIDPAMWDPKTDTALTQNFDILTVWDGKSAVKRALQTALKLPTEHVPLFGFVGRIEPRQKGTELIRLAIPKLLQEKFQVVILGTGEKKEETLLSSLARKYPNVRFINTFDERLARRIYAGSDIMLVPSKFEPCGLTQMIAMRYGTIPLVRKTGGLGDSVKDGQTGFVFSGYTASALVEKMRQAITLFKKSRTAAAEAIENDRETPWSEMMVQVMREDFSWSASAKQYMEMYRKLVGKKIS
jgi:starch synthase